MLQWRIQNLLGGGELTIGQHPQLSSDYEEDYVF